MVAVSDVDDPGSYLRKNPEHLRRSLKGLNPDIAWSGVSWLCGKQLRHYEAFCRNGTTIAIHSFVLVMSEEENRYLAYLEDMYEDKKGQKKVKVRWFHQNQEVLCHIPPPKPHPREVFITPYCQVISAECVDDLAIVLTPSHFESCFATLPHASSAGIHLCFRQYSKNKFKYFDLSSLGGYFDQAVLSCLDVYTVSGEGGLGNGSAINDVKHKKIGLAKGNQRCLAEGMGIRIPGKTNHIVCSPPHYRNSIYNLSSKRPLSVKFIGPRHWRAPSYKVGERIEFLCQDSGIRGCWFRCTVLQVSQKRLKVRYIDVQNEDECGNLEEWVPIFKYAAPDKLGMRCSSRFTIRPYPTHNYLPVDVTFQIGNAVDAWWSDGWWEGVVIGIDGCGDDSVQVYFPGEGVLLTCQRKHLRISKDWVGSRWVAVDSKPDVLSAISAVSSGMKLSACSSFAKGVESDGYPMSGRDVFASTDNAVEEGRKGVGSLSSRTDELLENTSQVNPRKRCRDEGVSGDSDGSGDGGEACN